MAIPRSTSVSVRHRPHRRDGSYAQVLRRRGLTHEAVTRSETDPNGLPLPGSRVPRDPRENT
ncbi:hypothetical protein [Streptomyces sp. NBC_00439]|uniref:hypothetical protein n=1 Tax=Streptomyces sp. NBC_00439 TaxID=2903650 RepID=UPI00225BE668|nr:hypothetical protein [Streptomyces sp. NBC_00439]MCX5099726.1 hypothetical protein [Streptomyces sp. NBC_00439]